MKRILAILVLIIGCASAHAQNKNAGNNEAYFYVQNGKTMVNDGGHVSQLPREVAIKDNLRITTEGMVLNSDGTMKFKLKEGERINERGILTRVEIPE